MIQSCERSSALCMQPLQGYYIGDEDNCTYMVAALLGVVDPFDSETGLLQVVAAILPGQQY